MSFTEVKFTLYGNTVKKFSVVVQILPLTQEVGTLLCMYESPKWPAPASTEDEAIVLHAINSHLASATGLVCLMGTVSWPPYKHRAGCCDFDLLCGVPGEWRLSQLQMGDKCLENYLNIKWTREPHASLRTGKLSFLLPSLHSSLTSTHVSLSSLLFYFYSPSSLTSSSLSFSVTANVMNFPSSLFSSFTTFISIFLNVKVRCRSHASSHLPCDF